ncbi:hypothetical protein COCC4DRAFT_36164 [Bipolaris maydis ATCC 48331]|uniref:Uncharacterized protein n=2 Tax=Cochliobolus heterostrophus TaxID=5016 RepID=M2SXA8_COCH5|nr:uncharacterized protein COCC4DRAFT_36164 [Bipolaris maydis ATCC 48331]EMD90005.1 hypothetical protein COCHEDRAFT_1215035 [Bipolaris maydis C5]KAJ5063911.1 hypothetical protein J3E74DRAFT_286588 [Bipolaris maydis]ENI09780.1 hypothetical protein COCC4DRAFT_36164 [Bipolaris maydis ATCC 48331]KAJ6207829.1 hypothetical protein PSV09DRAFT_1215035 [Bipolaris maydis]KAJ6269537.1 hypothetical protein PSV08DRAFT_248441 [Bipolaris maydis]
MSDTNPFPPFPPAVTLEAVQAATTAYPASYFTSHILKLSSYLVDITKTSTLFGKPSNDSYTPSLSTLYLRLQNGQLPPSHLPADFQTPRHTQSQIHLRSDKPAAERPLADFEDLYYATLSLMQELHHLLTIRLQSGFNTPSDLACPGGPTLAALHESLTAYWSFFNDAACAKALDDAVREARVRAIREEIVRKVEADELDVQDARCQLAGLYGEDVYAGVEGMWFVRDWAPAVVAVYLEGRYRGLLDAEKAESERVVAMVKSGKEGSAEQVERECPEAKRDMDVDPNQLFLPEQNHVEPLSCGTSIRTEPQISQDTYYSSAHHAPVYHPQLHHSATHHQEHSAAIHNEHHPTDLDIMLEWQVRNQRVAEYSNYLRARASQDAQQAIQESRGTGGTTGCETCTWNEMLGPDMNPDK